MQETAQSCSCEGARKRDSATHTTGFGNSLTPALALAHRSPSPFPERGKSLQSTVVVCEALTLVYYDDFPGASLAAT